MSPQRTLWYFADPMCSWCWGFSPVISALREAFHEQLAFELVLGGLRPGTTESITPEFRQEILHHWHEVQRRTGQPFIFDGAMPEGFVYDTEVPSRAVVAVTELKPAATFPYFKSVQTAFYAEQRDVTRPQILAELAQQQGLDPAAFLERFHSDTAIQATQMHFREARHAGIAGFPAVVMQRDAHYALLTYGYRPLDELQPTLEAWLAEAE